jgi:hypothetical protein
LGHHRRDEPRHPDHERHDQAVREVPVVVGDLEQIALRRVAGVGEHGVDAAHS